MTVLQTEHWTTDEKPGTTYGGAGTSTTNGSTAGAHDAPGRGPGSQLPIAPHMSPKAPEGPRLNKKQRAELLRRYRLRIDSAKKMRSAKGLDDKWKRLIKLYQGKHFADLLNTREDYITVNVAFSTINIIAPAVAVNHPKIVVEAQREDQENQAIVLEAIVNYWWRHFEIRPQFQRSVKDFLIFGFGWVKTGYRYVEEKAPATDEDLYGEFSALQGQQAEYLQQNPDFNASEMPSHDDMVASIPEAKVVTVVDRPFAVRVSPFDIFIDPEATSMEDAKWIAQKIVKTLPQVKGESKYDRKARDNASPDGTMNPDWTNPIQDYGDIEDDLQRVTVWEFYDLHNRTLCVFPESGDDFLVRPVYQPYTFGHPFEMLRNYDVPDEFYPIGELEMLEGLQLELDKTRSQMMNHRKRYAPKFLYDPSAFGPDGIEMLESEESNVAIPVVAGKPLDQVWKPLEQTQLPPEIYNQSQIIEADLDRVSGVNEYQRGAAPETRRTATEASIIQDAANARAADKLAQVESFIGRIARRLVQLAQQYTTEEQVARAVGKNGRPVWVPYAREDIQGEYDFSVEGGSTQPVNETARRQQASTMLQAFQPFAEAGIMDIQKLLEHALRFGFGVKNPQSFFKQPDPEAAAKQERPQTKLIETMSYKDTPEDIKRQIEQEAGFQPSQQGAPTDPAAAAAQQQADQHAHEVGMKAMDAHQTLATKGAEHAHEQEMTAEQAKHQALLEQLRGQVGLQLQNSKTTPPA